MSVCCNVTRIQISPTATYITKTISICRIAARNFDPRISQMDFGTIRAYNSASSSDLCSVQECFQSRHKKLQKGCHHHHCQTYCCQLLPSQQHSQCKSSTHTRRILPITILEVCCFFISYFNNFTIFLPPSAQHSYINCI